jgi:hypothetical protein
VFVGAHHPHRCHAASTYLHAHSVFTHVWELTATSNHTNVDV